MRFYLFFILVGYTVLQAQPTILPPTQTDEIIIDNGATGKADPNDRIRYKVTIQNTGITGATGTQLNIVPDPRTTFVAGTFRSSPLALPDAYTCTGNVPISIPSGSGLLANDFDDNIPGLTVTAGTFPTVQGGAIAIASNGSFTYTPPAGYTGTDSYSYTLNDGNGVGAGVPTTDMNVVTITVSNLIWFIDNAAAAGDGRRNTPFNSLTAFNAGSVAAGNVIYIEHTGTNYTGGIVLQNNEQLFGEGHTGGSNLANVLPFTLAPNSVALPAINGSRPLITNTTGDGIGLAQNNVLRGFDVGSCSDFGMDNLVAATVGNLTISEVMINNPTGGGFRAANGGALNVTLGSMTTTGGVNGISLSSTSGTFTTGTVSVTNPSGVGISLQSVSTVLSLGATTINKGASAGTGVHLASSSGNVTFLNLSITTNNGSALVGTEHTGSITITNNTGSLNATAGAAIDMTRTTGNTSINLNFSAITTTASPGFGIRLDNVGGTGLAVSGVTSLGMAAGSSNGILLENVSAGTYAISALNTVTISSRRSIGLLINNVTGSTLSFGNTVISNPNSITTPGIRCTSSAGSITFAQANIDMNSAGGFETFTDVYIPNDNSGDGDAIYITGFTGTGFTINGGTIENAGDDGIDIRNAQNLHLSNVLMEDAGRNTGISSCMVDCNSSNVQAFNLTGTNTITGSTFRRGRLRNFYFSQSSGSAVLNINGSSVFDDTRSQGTPASDNLQIYLSGNATASIDIENSSFLRSRTDQISVIAKGTAQITKLDITGITMDYVGDNSAGIRIIGEETNNINFNIMNNVKLHAQNENVVTVNAFGTSQIQGRIKDNPDMKYFSPSTGGTIFSGIRILSDGTTSLVTVLIENNSLEIVNCDFGINLAVQGANSPVINATVNSNTISATGMTHLEGIVATVNNIASIGKLICLTVNDNSVSGAALARVCRLRVLAAIGVRVTNYVTDMNTTWLNNGNTGSPVAEGTSGGGTIAPAPVPCAVPTNPLP